MEHLAVLATDTKIAVPKGDAVLRLAGEPGADEPVLDGVEAMRDSAIADIQSRYAGWLYGMVRGSGALDLAVFEGGLSWWWYTPMSERSGLRGNLLTRLHRILVFRKVLRRYRPKRATWHDEDDILRACVTAVASAEGCALAFVSPAGRAPFPRALFKLAAGALYSACRTLVARMALARRAIPSNADVLFLTRFPILWEEEGGQWRERMFDRLPAHLEKQGVRTAYAAVITGNPLSVLVNSRVRAALTQLRIYPLPALLGVGEVLAVHANLGFARKYFAWRKAHRADPVLFDDIDVSEAFWDELDRSTFDLDVSASRLTARALGRLAPKMPSLRCLFHPFEYQPLERAAWAGLRAKPDVKIVALQTGVFASSQLGFLPNREELQSGGAPDPRRAPMPDLLVTYGSFLSEKYEAVMEQRRLLKGVAMRYGRLAERVAADDRSGDQLNIPAGLVPILVACPMAAAEARPIVRAAIDLASVRSELFLIFKFHYHLPLDAEVNAAAGRVLPGRWTIARGGLHDLIVGARATLTGGSSVAFEALALGRPTLVYLPAAQWLPTSATAAPEAFTFWSRPAELARLIDRVLSGELVVDPAARERALEQQLNLDVSGESRLLNVLRNESYLPRRT